MEKAVRIAALVVAAFLAGTLFFFALAAALGMAVLGVVALFAAYALAPEDTKRLLGRTAGMIDGWVAAMVKMVSDAGTLMRDVLSGRIRRPDGDQPSSEPGCGTSPKMPEKADVRQE